MFWKIGTLGGLSVNNFWNQLLCIQSFGTERENKIRRVACIFWELWVARNGLIFRQDQSDPQDVLHAADFLFQEWCNPLLRSHDARTAGLEQTEAQLWQPPISNAFKVNFDGAFLVGLSKGAGACVVRDRLGRIIATAARQFQHVTSPTVVEALALREAILLARRLRLTDFVIE
ncbi:uncharacterized protein LOC126668643 [Mercurialis annua]|uniref:uncharacterized protein LOC126668643 n=1 Tax=Mercurialis annua TaxID=3986 RepID=UPI00216098EF|nr:uncharacterized protein LOC126668643 [Mercurialis annua]